MVVRKVFYYMMSIRLHFVALLAQVDRVSRVQNYIQ